MLVFAVKVDHEYFHGNVSDKKSYFFEASNCNFGLRL